MSPAARVHVGVSGWRYASWRGDLYPRGLPQRRELSAPGRLVSFGNSARGHAPRNAVALAGRIGARGAEEPTGEHSTAGRRPTRSKEERSHA